MADNSEIEWTDATWNPTTGCTKVSQGCANCYAKRFWHRWAGNPKTVYFGRPFEDVQCHPDRLDQPLRWKKPRRIFVNSMSDLFHEDVSDDFIADVFNVMAEAKHHTFQVLTKRPERMRDFMLGTSGCGANYDPIPNIWYGVSIEDQETANERIPPLLEIPATVWWLSIEPLLGPLDLSPWLEWGSSGPPWLCNNDEGNERAWVVCGGESGPKARPMHPTWARSLRDQCDVAGVPFFFKQWGEWLPSGQDDIYGNNQCTDEMYVRVGKKAAGRLLDGRTWNGMP